MSNDAAHQRSFATSSPRQKGVTRPRRFVELQRGCSTMSPSCWPRGLFGPKGQRRGMHMSWAPLVTIFVVYAMCPTNALAQWRHNQRSHQLSAMTTNDLVQLSSLGNAAAFRQLLKPILVERIVDTQSHRQVGDYLKSTVEQYGFSTEWDAFTDTTPYGRKPFRSLIATYDPLVPRRLVLACHYDSKILSQKFIAATDSAVPCAILLDIARTLGPFLHQRYNQHITLQLLFLDGEEAFLEWTEKDSIYGARHLAEKWSKAWYPSTNGSAFELSKELDRIDVFMLLDLIGAPQPTFRSTIGHGTTELFIELAKIETALRGIGQLRSVPNAFSAAPNYYAIEDDHIPFLKRGVPIMHVIAAPFPRVWHKPSDNEANLDFQSIYNINAVVRVFVARYLGLTNFGSPTVNNG
uniref:Glutaminyl-peptide cyclotransferase n=1 Tax=Panagrellus redivivus TaxID=6233 RepID=A0A7E4V6Q7_PANRE